LQLITLACIDRPLRATGCDIELNISNSSRKSANLRNILDPVMDNQLLDIASAAG